MSRVGKKSIQIPEGVKVGFVGDALVAKGAKGELSYQVHELISVALSSDSIQLTPKSRDKIARSLWGTSRSRVKNLLLGVSIGFEKRLEVIGVGYKAQMDGNVLILSLGYSKDSTYNVPDGISLSVAGKKQDQIIVSGIDLQLVGQTVAEICALRPPEPYKGKGVRCVGSFVLRKSVKK